MNVRIDSTYGVIQIDECELKGQSRIVHAEIATDIGESPHALNTLVQVQAESQSNSCNKSRQTSTRTKERKMC